ncbi:secreted protein [Melampsora americana]|nr:secreted protein [Melampsora americana]
MLSLKSPHQLVIIVMAVFTPQFSFTRSTNIKCLGGYNVEPPVALCNDKDFQTWKCPIAKCGRNGHSWIPMNGCLHNGVAGSGTSNQNCAQYNTSPKATSYGCKNTGGQIYICPFNTSAPPFLSCSDCTKPN